MLLNHSENKAIRKIFLPILIAMIFLSSKTIFAQAPNVIPYQGVARNAAGAILSNQPISLRVSLHDNSTNGTIVFSEIHSVTTTPLGLFSANIGAGNAITGQLSNVNWGAGAKFLQIEMDATGGSNYADMGTTQLNSVPYALFAGNAGSDKFVDLSNDQTISGNKTFNSNIKTNGKLIAGSIIYPNTDGTQGQVLGTNGSGILSWQNNNSPWITDNTNLYNKSASNIGIGTNAPVASAQLDVNSINKGFLPPRMTETQRNSIPGAVPGLMVWCSDCGADGELNVFTGHVWSNLLNQPPAIPQVRICDQIWMRKNLDVTTYKNGDLIPEVRDSAIWNHLTTGAWCWYNNDSATYAATYGKLYNWYAVNDPRGLAPIGWHVASYDEWSSLFTCVGGYLYAGGKLKETGTTHWNEPNEGASNVVGFTALPGGSRNFSLSVGATYDFLNIGIVGNWWTSTAIDINGLNYAISTNIQNNLIDATYFSNDDNSKFVGYSVRCIKN